MRFGVESNKTVDESSRIHVTFTTDMPNTSYGVHLTPINSSTSLILNLKVTNRTKSGFDVVPMTVTTSSTTFNYLSGVHGESASTTIGDTSITYLSSVNGIDSSTSFPTAGVAVYQN